MNDPYIYGQSFVGIVLFFLRFFEAIARSLNVPSTSFQRPKEYPTKALQIAVLEL